MKTKRHLKILEMVSEHDIETQEELSDCLKKEGYQVTQATISRDIRELKLTKISTGKGKQKYVALERHMDDMDNKYRRIFANAVIRMDIAQNILVVHTVSGMAMAVAAAIDSWGCDEIVGSIAGDDTVMSVARCNEDAMQIMEYLSKIVDETGVE